MQDMSELPRSYFRREGTKFSQLISTGCFQIVKGRYFEDCFARRQRIQPRQHIPQEYLFDGDTALKLWYEWGSMFLFAISYPWIDAAHPDPDLWHTERLAMIIAAYRKVMAKEMEQRNKRNVMHKKWVFPEDIGFIMDYTSLWQKEPDGQELRTRGQIKQFKEALSEINTPYGHEFISAWVLKSVPESVVRTYDDRGWTLFEICIIDSKACWTESKLRTVIHFDIKADEVNSTNFEEMFTRDGRFAWNSMQIRCQAPLTPERFLEELERKSQQAKAKNVNLFTNGKEDRPLVENKYRESFEELAKATSLNYISSEWGAEDVKELGLALPYFQNLERLNISGNPLKNDGAHAMAEALQEAPRSLRWVEVVGCSIGLSGQTSMVRAWWRRYPCSLMNCLASVPSCFFSCCNCACCCQGCICCSCKDGQQHYLHMHAQSTAMAKRVMKPPTS